MGKKERKSSAPAAAAPDASRLFDQTKKAIFEGARQGHLDLVLALFSKMEKSQAIRVANSRNEDNQSPLHLSCANGHTDVARYLLECKANANYRDSNGCTPVLYAARSAAWDTCELLLTVPKYLDVEGADHDKKTPLHCWAMQKPSGQEAGYKRVFSLLIEKGAPLDAQDIDGNTPLHLACASQNWTAQVLLLQSGAGALPNNAGELPQVREGTVPAGKLSTDAGVEEVPTGLEEVSIHLMVEGHVAMEAIYNELSWLGDKFSSTTDMSASSIHCNDGIVVPCESTAGPDLPEGSTANTLMDLLSHRNGSIRAEFQQALNEQWAGEMLASRPMELDAGHGAVALLVPVAHHPVIPCRGACAYDAMRVVMLHVLRRNRRAAAGEGSPVTRLLLPLFPCSTRTADDIVYQLSKALRQVRVMRRPIMAGPDLDLAVEQLQERPTLSRADKEKQVRDAVLENRLGSRGLFSMQEVSFLEAWAVDQSNMRLQLASIKAILMLLLGDLSVAGSDANLKSLRNVLFMKENSCLSAILQLAEEDKVKGYRNVDADLLDVQEKIGTGATAIVYRAVYKGEVVAYKEFNQEVDLRTIRRELTMMSLLSHPCLLPIIGAGERNGRMFAVTPFMAKGDLHSVIAKGRPPIEVGRSMAVEICNGMLYLHSMNIHHRDLKPLNLLVSESGRVLIADYGTCLVRSSSSRNQEAVGTVAWMAPEVLQNKQQYSNAADVYSFGMCLYEIISGEVPFSDIPSVAIPVAVSKGSRPQLSKDLPKAWVKLVQLCWHERPAKRPSFERIIHLIAQMDAP